MPADEHLEISSPLPPGGERVGDGGDERLGTVLTERPNTIKARSRRNQASKSSWSWWPFLFSSLIHFSALMAFIQFGNSGAAGGGSGPRHDNSIALVGRFLESVEEEGGAGGDDGSAIQVTGSFSDPASESEELASPAEDREESEAEQEVETEPPTVAPVERLPGRTVRSVAHVADRELEPPPDFEPPEETVIEEPAPRASRVATRTTDPEGGPRGAARSARPGRGSGNGEGDGDGVGFFGLEARARTVVYVIDASSSMETHSAMAQAIAELEASLDALAPTAKYAIIFFNNAPSTLPASGSSQPFANTPRNRRIAQQFISSIVPDAGSDRLLALMAAVSFKPDAIFLLTDAGEPPLEAADLETFRRRNRGRAPVHVVEFGVGVQLVRENFLTRLARQNAGGYRYVDLTAE